MLKGTGLEDASIYVGKSIDLLRGTTADDNADGNLTSEIKIEGTVNVYKAGTYILIYSVTDSSGNKAVAERTVMVVDNLAPTISGVGTIYVRYFEPFDPMKGVTATDNNDGDLTSKVVVKTNGPGVDHYDLNTIGTYDYEYSVSDEAGNTKMGVVTSIGPSSSMNMRIDFEDGKGPKVNGGKLSIFAKKPNGNTYEYSIKFSD